MRCYSVPSSQRIVTQCLFLSALLLSAFFSMHCYSVPYSQCFVPQCLILKALLLSAFFSLLCYTVPSSQSFVTQCLLLKAFLLSGFFSRLSYSVPFFSAIWLSASYSVVNMQNRGIAHLSKQQVPEIMLICNVDAVAFFSVQPDSVVNM